MVHSVGSEVRRIGSEGEFLSERAIERFIEDCLGSERLDGRSLCVLVPDATRSCPLPPLLAALHRAVGQRVTRLTILVALGTHRPMTDPELSAHLAGGASLGETFPRATVTNHEWWRPEQLTTVGSIAAARVRELSGGLIDQEVPVEINRAVIDHDVTLIVGPVLPHEVVGYSGGNKYLFPGVSGRQVVDVTHWLGALLTSAEMIGRPGTTPVRALIDEAAGCLPGRRLALCLVTGRAGGLHSMSFGTPEEAWASAVDTSSRVHVTYLERPVQRVLSILPERYDDMWTGAKGFYKVEPVVADGGQVVIYAPHISQLSVTHPDIASIGYHCRDYFLYNWDSYKGHHWGDLAHSTHLKGAGTYDPRTGEHSRVTVTLATSVPEAVVRAANLDYLDPATVDVHGWTDRPDTLVVRDAGEHLFRLGGAA
ncbi:MAG: DUF2088 domain-containing protein [Acidobacteriota bacterium]|nr:DUF2088 domain-containing protein [Acidobacteriota bacterium]